MSKLPEGWKEVKLGDILKVQTGKKNAQDAVENGTYPFFTRSIDTQRIDTYSYDTEALFIAGEGNFAVKYYNGKFDLHQRTYMLTALKDNTIDLKFLQNNIQPKVKKLVSTSVGSTVQSLRKPIIESLKIPLPPLEEQKKIAEILSTVDRKIAFVDNRIEESELLKKGLMQKLLTEGIGHTEFKDSEVGRIPESWEVHNFGKHMDVKSGYGFKASEYSDTGTPLVKIDNVSYERIIWENKTYLPDSYIESYPELVLQEYDILLALNRPITNNKLKMAMLKKSDSPSILYQRVGKILFDNKIYDRNFTFHILYKHVYTFVEQHSVGSDQPFINITKLRKMPIPLPPLEEQKQIAEILSTTDEKLENLKAKKESFEELKKGLMQKLLTGEVRV